MKEAAEPRAPVEADREASRSGSPASGSDETETDSSSDEAETDYETMSTRELHHAADRRGLVGRRWIGRGNSCSMTLLSSAEITISGR